MPGPRLTPTLFDKLVADVEMEGLRDGEVSPRSLDEVRRTAFRFYTVPRIERFNEAALKATLQRELNWLLNTTQLAAVQDLERYPEVARSVLNYGVPELAGAVAGAKALDRLARELREAIRTFEPRLNAHDLEVEVVDPEPGANRHSIVFVIRGDIVSAVQAMPVEYRTEVEIDTGAAAVSE